MNLNTLLSSLFILMFSGVALASECPTAREWRALKARAFFNTQFAAASMCKDVIADIDRRNGDVREKLTETYRDFYQDQIRIASGFYDRTQRGGTSRQTEGYNSQLGNDETRLLNRTSVETSNPQTSASRYTYCTQASDSLDAVLAATSSDEILEIAVRHPYASEHGITNCRER